MLYWALFRATGPAMASRGKLCRKLTQTNFESIDLLLFSLSYTFIILQSYRKPTCAETAKGTVQSVNYIQTKRVNQTIKQNRYFKYLLSFLGRATHDTLFFNKLHKNLHTATPPYGTKNN